MLRGHTKVPSCQIEKEKEILEENGFNLKFEKERIGLFCFSTFLQKENHLQEDKIALNNKACQLLFNVEPCWQENYSSHVVRYID